MAEYPSLLPDLAPSHPFPKQKGHSRPKKNSYHSTSGVPAIMSSDIFYKKKKKEYATDIFPFFWFPWSFLYENGLLGFPRQAQFKLLRTYDVCMSFSSYPEIVHH